LIDSGATIDVANSL
jgi:hypothetical protein